MLEFTRQRLKVAVFAGQDMAHLNWHPSGHGVPAPRRERHPRCTRISAAVIPLFAFHYQPNPSGAGSVGPSNPGCDASCRPNWIGDAILSSNVTESHILASQKLLRPARLVWSLAKLEAPVAGAMERMAARSAARPSLSLSGNVVACANSIGSSATTGGDREIAQTNDASFCPSPRPPPRGCTRGFLRAPALQDANIEAGVASLAGPRPNWQRPLVNAASLPPQRPSADPLSSGPRMRRNGAYSKEGHASDSMMHVR